MAKPGKLDKNDAQSLAGRIGILCLAFFGTLITGEVIPYLEANKELQPIVMVALAALGEALVKIARDTDDDTNSQVWK